MIFVTITLKCTKKIYEDFWDKDLFLNNARKERIPVTIFLMNGVQVKGNVRGFDSYIILLEGENRQQNMIYKHAVSTIVPSKYINLQNQQNNR